jgi:8-oxo-dGTP pyrophosphatase MutT (NUDIX family)
MSRRLQKCPCVFNCDPCKNWAQQRNSKMRPHLCKFCLGVNVHKSQDCPNHPCVFNCDSCTSRIRANGYVPAHVCRMCGALNDHRTADCKKNRSSSTSVLDIKSTRSHKKQSTLNAADCKKNRSSSTSVLHIKSTQSHKKQSTLNAAVVGFTLINGSPHVLVQKRSPNGFTPIANKIGVPGGQYDHGDRDSRVTGAREILEEAGVVIDTKTLQVFHSTRTCDWMATLIQRPVFGKAIDAHECGNFNLSELPHGSVHACFGHAWVPVNSLHKIPASTCIGGLHKRVEAARKHMCF